MSCPNCGAEINDNRRFCGKCGTEVNPRAAAPPPSAPGTPPSSWGTPGTWGAPASPVTPPATAPPPPAEHDPFAAPDLYAPPPGSGSPPPSGYPPSGYPPPGYPPPGYPPPGYTQAGYPQPGYPPTGYAPGYGERPTTNGFAVASLVLSLVGWLPCGIGSVLAIVFGFIAREQIKRNPGREHGSGMATAGIVIGFVAIAFWLLFFVVGLAGSGSNS